MIADLTRREGRFGAIRSARLAAVALAFCCLCCRAAPPLNVVLITLDTTRADHLGCYGHEGIETPHIDRLAAEGTLYERCYTPVPITLPSHLSILTGTYPAYHGVHENAGFYVAPELVTWPEVLKRHGYATAAFVGAFPLDSQTGLDQGFDLYDDNYPSSLEEGKHPSLQGFFDERPAADVVRPALEWLADRRGPYFLWTHFFDPHQPQIPPSPFRERYSDALYDGEIAAVDEAIGRLLARLEERDDLDRTLIVLTADHGEGLGEHGEKTHALLLHSSTIRVPLLIRDPRGPAGERVSAPVATVDILPTVLDRLGIESPPAVQGDLLPRKGGEPTPRRSILSETLYGALLHGWSPLERLTVEDWMYVHGPSPRLYNLAEDPQELTNLAGEQPSELLGMQHRLAERKRQLAGEAIDAAESSVSPEKRARLMALGYLGTGGTVDATVLAVSDDLPDPHTAIAVFREMSEGKQLSEGGQPGLAAAVLERAKQTDPTNPFLTMLLAQAYQRLGDAEALRRALDHLLRIAPEHHGAHLLRAEQQEKEGDLAAAVATLERALELDPRNQATRLYLAHRLEDLRRDADAETTYRALLETAPDHTLARNGLSTLLSRQGRFDEAIAELEKLRRSQPFFAPAYLNLAVIRHEQGRLEESEHLVERALALRSSYGVAYELLALNREAQGDPGGARSAWHQAHRYAADAAARSRAVAALGSLE
ncbi:MAG: sulfatase-like hydrolase/transferase [Acidobacteriota bacterium]